MLMRSQRLICKRVQARQRDSAACISSIDSKPSRRGDNRRIGSASGTAAHGLQAFQA